ncbi:glycosyl transferase [Actinoplanes sp. SE50]|uniref:glycosyltransferase family 2 protein n=1 Tax=unclassified Actinoplanes TaxID=2626549 RepID=UPI00023EC255|nr:MULTISPECIES: glycosyltransferase [unclassified Actinoplanes]AEV83551.1 glycosyl transferase, group 2 family protein [Actinoplanes sp. SE50/110]ATO82305.1 glycosyl transferase [Actinoplanes sp. SE50]SLL99712.1 glycosyl transferase [Actinoplanes sp. SE50/110]
MSVINAQDVETDEVTVVVATRNRADRLRDTVPHHRAPTIIVDNASDQPLDFPGVVRLPENLGAAARNIGVELATTPYVAFADDDSYWQPDSLAQAAKIFRAHPRTALLTARVLIGPEARVDPISDEMARAPLGTAPDAPGPAVLGFLSCATIVRRDAFLGVNGFHPRLFVYGEEALLAMDLAAAGHHLAYVQALTVRHFPEPAGRDPRARLRREARNRALTALLRRPPRVVATTLAEVARTEPAALLDVTRDLPWALTHRRPLPGEVEAALRRLES